jgi:sec-independent protein translocase protein TatA
MGSMSIWHWIIVLAVGLLLFGGRGKISELMGDMAKGIKAFKKGMTEDDKAEVDPPKPAEPVRTIDHLPQSATTTSPSAELNKRSDTEKKFEGGTA